MLTTSVLTIDILLVESECYFQIFVHIFSRTLSEILLKIEGRSVRNHCDGSPPVDLNIVVIKLHDSLALLFFFPKCFPSLPVYMILSLSLWMYIGKLSKKSF